MNEIAATPSVGVDAAIQAVPGAGEEPAAPGGDPRGHDRRLAAGRRRGRLADHGRGRPAGWDKTAGVHDDARARRRSRSRSPTSSTRRSRRALGPASVRRRSRRPATLSSGDAIDRRPCPSAPPFVDPGARRLAARPPAGRSTWPTASSRSTPRGRIAAVGTAADAAPAGASPASIDLRPWVVLPGMVDLHAHLPQVPNAGLGYALPLLDWLDRLTFPTERSWADPAVAERLAPAIFRAFAAAGTTTVLAYGVVYEAAMDAAFRAAEAHGIRAILGKVMMDRLTYDPTIEPSTILERTLRESRSLAERWHGAADGPARLRGHAALRRSRARPSCCASRRRSPASSAAGGRATSRRIRREIAEVARLFPEARDYVDVYDRAGALGERSILAHAIHLSPREEARLAETGTRDRPLPDVEPVHRRRGDAARPRGSRPG